MRSIFYGAFALSLAGCGARSELDVPTADAGHDAAHVHDAAPDVFDAGVDVEVPPLSPFCVASDASAPATVCTVNLIGGTVVKMAGGCYVDVVVHEGDLGSVSYACDDPSSTWASITFGGTTFQGTVTNKTFIDVCLGTTYPWQDGPSCHYAQSTWASAQRIYGDLATGELTLVYDEEKVAGESCDIACTAHVTVMVQ